MSRMEKIILILSPLAKGAPYGNDNAAKDHIPKFSSKEEANHYFEKEVGVKLAHDFTGREPAEYSEAELLDLGKIGVTLKNLKEKYPLRNEKLLHTLTISNTLEWSYRGFYTGKFSVSNPDSSSAELLLNMKMLANDFENDLGLSKSMTDTVTHEYGHLLHAQEQAYNWDRLTAENPMSRKTESLAYELADVQEEVVKLVKGENTTTFLASELNKFPDLKKYAPSGYSLTSINEFVAESFLAYEKGEDLAPLSKVALKAVIASQYTKNRDLWNTVR